MAGAGEGGRVGIEIDSAVFASDGSRSNEQVIIVGASDPQAAGLALAPCG
jgi:hypothetical protein